jgi:hypothetical protein
MSDTVLAAAVAGVEAARLNEKRLAVRSFFDEAILCSISNLRRGAPAMLLPMR